MTSDESRARRYRAQAMDLLRTAAMSKNVHLKQEYVRLAHEYQALADEVDELERPLVH
jgi:hypothetical protein